MAAASLDTDRTPKLSPAARKRIGVENKLIAHGSEAVKHALTAAESQLAICYLKVLKWALAFFVLVPAALAFIVVGIYGCILLDRAADAALSASNPAWFSPLVRGGAYCLVVAAVIGPLLWGMFREPKASA